MKPTDSHKTPISKPLNDSSPKPSERAIELAARILAKRAMRLNNVEGTGSTRVYPESAEVIAQFKAHKKS